MHVCVCVMCVCVFGVSACVCVCVFGVSACMCVCVCLHACDDVS